MFQASVLIHGVKTLVDGGNSLTLHTQDLPPDEMVKLFELRGKQIWCAFKETEVKTDDLEIPELVPEFSTDKTPSQRLRNVLYRYWEKNLPTKTFAEFYPKKMDEIIEIIKEKLE